MADLINDMKNKAAHAADFLRTLAHPDRLMILCQLIEGEKSVAELQAQTDLSQSAFSQHLAKIREQHLVATRKNRQSVYYRLSDPNVQKILNVLYDIYCR